METKMFCAKSKCRGKDENGFCKGYEEAIEGGGRFNCVYGVKVKELNNTPKFEKPVPPPPPTTGSNAYKPARRVEIFTVNQPRDSFLNKKIESEKEALKKDNVIKEIYTEGRWEKSNPYLTVEVETKRMPEKGEYTAALLCRLIDNYCKRFEKIIVNKTEKDTIKIKFENKR